MSTLCTQAKLRGDFYLLGYNTRAVLALLANCFALISCSSYSLSLKTEAKFSSEMSVDFQRTT
jgi:hypothetical protein